jgi:hypothetical protein
MPTTIEIHEFTSIVEAQKFIPTKPRIPMMGTKDVAASVESEASIERYLRASEVTCKVADVTWKLCAGLFVIVLAAWAWGVLPGAVHLF